MPPKTEKATGGFRYSRSPRSFPLGGGGGEALPAIATIEARPLTLSELGGAVSSLPTDGPGGRGGDGPVALFVWAVGPSDGVLAGRPGRTARWVQAARGRGSSRVADVERAAGRCR